MIKKNVFNSSIYFILFSVLIAISSLLKFNYIFGSTASFFHGSTIFLPLSGFWFGSLGASVFFLTRALFKYAAGFSAVSYVLYHVPSFCGALYWAVGSGFFRIGFPLFCMVAFIMHPEGFQAAAYASFWLIPILVHGAQLRGIFWHALSSTFIAHAAGSIIWLYMANIPAATWLALMPIVCLERLVCALGMVFAVQVVEKVKQAVRGVRALGNDIHSHC